MAYTPEANETTTNDTTAVTIVAAPGASEQIIVPVNGVSVFNNDTVAATVQLLKDKNSTTYVLEEVSLDPGETFTNGTRIILDATDETVQVVLGGTVTTNQLDVTASYGVNT